MRPHVIAVCVVLIPAAAHATWSVEASLGQGMQLSPKPVGAATATSIGVTVGWAWLEPLELQLAVLPQVDSLNAGELDVELRTMLKIAPPGIPTYGRVIAGLTHLVAGPRDLALGGGIGWEVKVAGVGVFAEINVLPRPGFGKGGAPKMQWVVEGRVGSAVRF